MITSAYNITLTPAGKNSIPILEIRISQIPSMELAGITLPQRSAVKISIPKRAGGKGTPRALMMSVDTHCKSSKKAIPRNKLVGDILFPPHKNMTNTIIIDLLVEVRIKVKTAGVSRWSLGLRVLGRQNDMLLILPQS